MRIAAAVGVLAAVAGYLTVQYVSSGRGSDQCTVRSADGSYRMTPEQAANAATISAVGTRRGMPERAVTIALATALQESALHNLGHGDKDSLGLFQQRPSQGWGTARQVMDPVYAAGKFYQHLAEVPGYSRLPLTEAAQRVQRSGFPQAYAKHEPDAALLAAALTGRTPAALDCEPPRTTAGTGDATKVRAALVSAFGKGVLPAGTGAAGSSSSGALTVPVRADRRADRDGVPQRGWELAHWAVAQSEALGIDEVAYGGRVWAAGSGWHTEREPSRREASDADEVRLRLVG
ncbi:hypothetical protein ABZ565_26595 [Streptomyces sp. NPDC016469]|uniref:hypothetical protein n=1 Tax=Streptomyces sp. NPDC016469 TaxID=3157191 RepID=UPI00340028F4